VDVDNRTVTFTGLLRGRFGTDQIAHDHAVGELVMYYDPDSVSLVDVGKNAVTLKHASSYLYNFGTEKYFTADVGYVYQDMVDARRPWSGMYASVKKVTTGSLSTRGVFIRAGIRKQHVNTFEDTLETLATANNRSDVFMYLLKAPYDEALFMAKVLENNYPKNGETSAGSNSYIRRRIRMTTQTSTQYNRGTQYTETLLINDTFSYTSDLHVAIAIHYGIETTSTTVPNPIVGRPTGLLIEGKVNYATYKQVVEYN